MVPLQLLGSIPLTDFLPWIAVLGFLLAALLEYRNDEWARPVAVGAWFVFALFWLSMIPHFVFEQKSIVEGIGSIVAVPTSVYAGYLLWNGRDSLFLLTRAIGIMGLVYLPFSYLPFLAANPAREFLIEATAYQTDLLLGTIGVEPELVRGVEYVSNPGANADFEYLATFRFEGNTQPITYSIILACTGLGSIAIFTGAILAVRAPWERKARALAVAVPVIYVLNLGRNVFIATMFGQQRMQWFVDPVMALFALNDPQLVSYYIADRLLAQVGSVVALVVITLLVVRQLPELVVLVEDALRVVTGREFDLADAIGLDVPERARTAGLDD